MKESEIQAKIDEIRKGLRWVETIVHHDFKDGSRSVTQKQAEIVQGVIDLLDTLNWAIKFSAYKELRHGDKKALDQRGCGKAVKIRSCKDGHGDKTYFGIYIGDVSMGISHKIKDGVVTAEQSSHNPAIFVPELGEVVYGCESWWGEIDSEEEMNKLITDETIQNVWYVKALRESCEESTSNEQGKG